MSTPTTRLPDVDSLAQIMDNIRISQASIPNLIDEHLTEVVLETIFGVLLDDVKLLLQSLSAPRILNVALESLFTHLVLAVRKPYISQIVERRLKLEKQHLKLEKQTEVHHQELANLHEKHQALISQLNREQRVELARLNDERRAAVSQLNATGLKEILAMKTKVEEISRDKQLLLVERKLQDNHSGVPASVNRAETWHKVLNNNPGRQDLDHPVLPIGNMIDDPSVLDLELRDFPREPLMYLPFHQCLKANLATRRSEPHAGINVWDTHASKNLDGRSPDMTITVDNTSKPDPFSIIAIWELKVGALDYEAHGQVYDYLEIISKNQADRSHFIGVLSNIKDNIIITLTRLGPGQMLQCSTYKTMNLTQAMSHIRSVALHNPEYLPPIPAFSIDLGVIHSRLGDPAYSVVAAFTLPRNIRSKSFMKNRWISVDATDGDGKSTMVVKRNVPARGKIPPRSVESEIQILKLIERLGGHENLPRIVYHSNDFKEFAIQPHGYPIQPGEKYLSWRQALGDVLSALRWLHSYKIIHRDVRWDNVVWAHERAVLIDFGAAVYHPEPKECYYDGGYICCPPAVIPNFNNSYIPRPADDCHAFVLMFNMLCWPEQWKNLRTKDVGVPYSDVARQLMRFWEDARVSPFWKVYVEAAERADYKYLGRLLDHCVYFGGSGV